MVQLGPVPAGVPADSCGDVALPAETDADVACWCAPACGGGHATPPSHCASPLARNYINGYTGCNTPWPSN